MLTRTQNVVGADPTASPVTHGDVRATQGDGASERMAEKCRPRAFLEPSHNPDGSYEHRKSETVARRACLDNKESDGQASITTISQVSRTLEPNLLAFLRPDRTERRRTALPPFAVIRREVTQGRM